MEATLSATLRDKRKPSQLRRADLLPAVLYGPGISTRNIILSSYREFVRVFQKAGESQVIYLDIEKEKIPVLIQEIQQDPLSERFLHVDLYRFKAGSKVHAKIPIEFKGVSLAVKDKGGMLLTNIRELEVRALPDKLVSSIPVDIYLLNEIGEEIKVSDLSVPEGIEVLQSMEGIVVSVVEPQKIKEEEAPLEQAVAAEGATETQEGEKSEEEVKKSE